MMLNIMQSLCEKHLQEGLVVRSASLSKVLYIHNPDHITVGYILLKENTIWFSTVTATSEIFGEQFYKKIYLENPDTDLEHEIKQFLQVLRYYNVKRIPLDRPRNNAEPFYLIVKS